MLDENKNEEVNENEETEEVLDEGTEENLEEKKDDRPEVNWRAELERKNRELDRARQELEARSTEHRRDPADLSTWSDHELKAVMKSNDATTAPYKDQAEEILLDRRIRAIRDRELQQDKRIKADLELRSKYPAALDQTSEFSARVEAVMYEYDLQKSPAGRLAAARIVDAEVRGSKKSSSASSRKTEESRVRSVKSQLVDGDRPQPTKSGKATQKEVEAIEKGLSKGSEAAVGDALKLKGIDRNSFFGGR